MRIVLSLIIIAALFQSAVLGAADDERTIPVRVTVPSGGWSVKIDQVYRVGEELWVVSSLARPAGASIQVISMVEDSVTIEAPDLPLRHFVLGKTWNWKNDEAHQFPADRTRLDKDLKKMKAQLLFQRKKVVKNADAKANYIVAYRKDVFTDGRTAGGETLQQLANRHMQECGGTVTTVLAIINGYGATLSPAALKKVQELAEVKYVERDQ